MADSPPKTELGRLSRIGPSIGSHDLLRVVDRRRVRQSVPFLSLLLTIALFSRYPNFISISNLENILRQLPVLLLVGIGQCWVLLVGGVDLSVGAIVTLSGAVGAVLVAELGEGAILFALLVGLGAGLVNGVLVAKARLPSFLVTLGTLFALAGLAQIVTGGVPRPYVGPVSHELTSGTFSVGSLEITYLTVIALAVAAGSTIFALATVPGHYIYAVGGGEVAARLAGVNVDRYKILAFSLSGLFAGAGGLALTMRAQAATPRMGDAFLLLSLAAVVVGGTSLLGGVGGPQWTLLGALVIITLDNGMVIAGINPDYQAIIRGMVIIVAAALTLKRVGVIK